MTNAPDSDALANDGLPKISRRFVMLWAGALAGLIVGYLLILRLLLARVTEPWAAPAIGVAAFLFAAGMIAVCVVPTRILRGRGFEDDVRPAYKRLSSRVVIGVLGYVITFIVAAGMVRSGALPSPFTWLAALAPAAFLLFWVRSLILFMNEEDDEFLRQRLYRAAFHATVGALAICGVWGMLDAFGLVVGAKLWAVLPIWATCFGAAQILEMRDYA